MADILESALAQNTKQTQTDGVYQSRLQNPQFTPSAPKGGDLASSLGLLGNTIIGAYADQEKRTERFGVEEADRIVAAQDDKDMRKLNAIEMIGNYTPDKELQDNPYAIATIEKMRGQYIAAQSNDEYTAWRSQQPPTKNATEELARYNNFIEGRKVQGSDTTLNQKAFEKGFNEKFLANQLVIASQQRTEQATELRAIQKGTMQASLSDIIRKAPQMGADDTMRQVQDTFNSARISWMSIPERTEFAKEALKEIATTSGDYKLIERMANQIAIGTDRDGKTIAIGDVVPFEQYKQVAEQKTAQMYGERVQASIKALQGMSVPEQNAWFAKQQAEDPEWFNVMTPFRDNMIKYREALEKKQAIRQAK